jgi:hypothetical protein
MMKGKQFHPREVLRSISYILSKERANLLWEYSEELGDVAFVVSSRLVVQSAAVEGTSVRNSGSVLESN